MTAIYIHLDYESYKQLEQQCREFKETTHKTTPIGFYHKSWRITIGPGLVMEFHGPAVGGEGHLNPEPDHA